MENEIDLRKYIGLLLRNWMWIGGLALVGGVGAFVVSLLLPKTYEASAMVIVTQPRYQMQFDPRFETSTNWMPANRVFPALAASDDILLDLLEVLRTLPGTPGSDYDLAQLSGTVEASLAGDPSLMLLQVRSRSPQEAAAIANAWADITVQRANMVYGESDKDVAFFENQQAQSEQTLNAAEAQLVAFQARNQSSIVNAQLRSLEQRQADYLADQRMASYIVQDIRGLREQLAGQGGSQAVSLSDSLTALFLQIKAFNATASAPIELQVDSGAALSDKSLSEQIAFLDSLAETLEIKSGHIDTLLANLEPDILALQQKLEGIQVELDRLTRARDIARETYMSLSRKLDEARIAAQEEEGILQVGSYAAVPKRPAGPRKLISTALAAILGLMVGVAAVLVLDFWRGSGTTSAK